MSKLTFKKKIWVVKEHEKGVDAVSIALAQKIHRSAVYQIIEKFNEFGWGGLKDQKTGRHELSMNPKAVDLILDIRKKYRYGTGQIEEILKKTRFWHKPQANRKNTCEK